MVWANPRSLAATDGITIVFSSSGYLDVSVPLVCLLLPMYSVVGNCPLRQLGFPIRKSPDQSLLTAPRGGIVVRHVLLRLLVPRHPPCALTSLTKCSGFPIRALVVLRTKVARMRKTYAAEVHRLKAAHNEVMNKTNTFNMLQV